MAKMSLLISEKSFLSCRKNILHVLGEEKRSFLGASGAKMKTLAARRPEELVSAFRIGALDAGDTSSIAAA